MQEFLTSEWFSLGGIAFSYGEVLWSLLFTVVCVTVYLVFTVYFLPRYFDRFDEPTEQRFKVSRIITSIMYLSIVTGLILLLSLNVDVLTTEFFTLRLGTIMEALLIMQTARLADWIISRLVVNRYYNKRDEPPKPLVEKKKDTKASASRTVQFAVYIFATLLVLTNFEIDYTIYSPPQESDNTEFNLRVSNILAAILTLFIARLVAWVIIEIILYSYYRRIKVDAGSQYALNQILRYVIYLVGILVALDQLGINTTLVLGGLAALLVGIGLGLQQTFNDFFSGIILLFERSVEVNDVLDVNGMVGKVQKIGIRASTLETRDNLTVVVPNSKLVSDNVVNWSHEDVKVRFNISVPVPYGTTTDVVKEILLATATQSPYILEFPPPFVRLVEFADSALMFELHFWSTSFMLIEDVKSDLRIQVNDKLIESGIAIPFPQRDIWIRSQPEL